MRGLELADGGDDIDVARQGLGREGVLQRRPRRGAGQIGRRQSRVAGRIKPLRRLADADDHGSVVGHVHALLGLNLESPIHASGLSGLRRSGSRSSLAPHWRQGGGGVECDVGRGGRTAPPSAVSPSAGQLLTLQRKRTTKDTKSDVAPRRRRNKPTAPGMIDGFAVARRLLFLRGLCAFAVRFGAGAAGHVGRLGDRLQRRLKVPISAPRRNG